MLINCSILYTCVCSSIYVYRHIFFLSFWKYCKAIINWIITSLNVWRPARDGHLSFYSYFVWCIKWLILSVDSNGSNFHSSGQCCICFFFPFLIHRMNWMLFLLFCLSNQFITIHWFCCDLQLAQLESIGTGSSKCTQIQWAETRKMPTFEVSPIKTSNTLMDPSAAASSLSSIQKRNQNKCIAFESVHLAIVSVWKLPLILPRNDVRRMIFHATLMFITLSWPSHGHRPQWAT